MASSSRTIVDQKDYDLFKNLSSNWWNNPDMKLLRSTCNLFVPYICEKIQESYKNKPLHSLRILEVGCAGGFLTEGLAQAGCNVVAIDVNKELIEIAKAHLDLDSSLPKIIYLTESIEEHCIENRQKYDVVLSNFVLEHVDEHDYFIKCCSDCLKPSGLLFISTIAKTFWSWICTIVLLEYILGIVPLGAHDYYKYINASDAECIIRSYGFAIKNTRGIFCNLLNKTSFFVPTNAFAYIIFAARNAE